MTRELPPYVTLDECSESSEGDEDASEEDADEGEIGNEDEDEVEGEECGDEDDGENDEGDTAMDDVGCKQEATIHAEVIADASDDEPMHPPSSIPHAQSPTVKDEIASASTLSGTTSSSCMDDRIPLPQRSASYTAPASAAAATTIVEHAHERDAAAAPLHQSSSTDANNEVQDPCGDSEEVRMRNAGIRRKRKKQTKYVSSKMRRARSKAADLANPPQDVDSSFMTGEADADTALPAYSGPGRPRRLRPVHVATLSGGDEDWLHVDSKRRVEADHERASVADAADLQKELASATAVQTACSFLTQLIPDLASPTVTSTSSSTSSAAVTAASPSPRPAADGGPDAAAAATSHPFTPSTTPSSTPNIMPSVILHLRTLMDEASRVPSLKQRMRLLHQEVRQEKELMLMQLRAFERETEMFRAQRKDYDVIFKKLAQMREMMEAYRKQMMDRTRSIQKQQDETQTSILLNANVHAQSTPAATDVKQPTPLSSGSTCRVNIHPTDPSNTSEQVQQLRAELVESHANLNAHLTTSRKGLKVAKQKYKGKTKEFKKQLTELKCTQCKKRLPQVLYQPCGHILYCRRCDGKRSMGESENVNGGVEGGSTKDFCPNCGKPIRERIAALIGSGAAPIGEEPHVAGIASDAVAAAPSTPVLIEVG